ncbi:MAG: type II toxin-antitoxin system HicA family toxin [Prevotellaceae bacterium]|jgi:predicted RNA binding protein YcfA (HicA-like mRNA interferase family)|nr:type II toxin-antitoxin system HicA family toxin [Prevotellaceae bacterium]
MKRIFKTLEVLKILYADGWSIKAIKGDHRQLHHPTKPGKVTVSGKLSAPVPNSNLKSIERQSGVRIQETN